MAPSGPPGDDRLPREFRLAAACALWPHSERRVKAVRRVAGEGVDWPRFLRVATRQRILGLAADGIIRAEVAAPPEVIEKLRFEALAMARQALAMAAEAIRLRRDFAEAGIATAFLKGATLAMLAYGSIAIRHSKDIDMLVPEDCIFAAAALLEHSGYRRVEPDLRLDPRRLDVWIKTFKHFTYIHDTKRIQVELHWRLSDNPLLAQVPDPSSWREIEIMRGVTLPTLAGDDLFAYLCAHGAYHAWFRLKWLADIGALLALEPAGDGARLYESAAARGAARPATQALLLGERILGIALPESLASGGTDRVARWLASIATIAMTRGNAEIEPHDLSFGTTTVSASEYLLDGWRFRLRQARRDLVNEQDWILLPLPERLAFLYPVMRVPLWAWRRALLRGRSRRQA